MESLKTVLWCALLVACGGSASKKPVGPVEAPHEVHIAIAKVTPRLESGKLWIKFQATPKKVMTGQAVLVRAACNKDGGAPMTDSSAWSVPENTIDQAKDIDIPLEKITNATACQFEFQLVADMMAMSGEHASTACWNAGKVTDGPCSPPITESFAQGIATLCTASVRWDTKGLDKDPELVKFVAERVWNQQAKDVFAKLLKDPEAKRAAPLKAEATKQGVVDCALANFWAAGKQ